MPLNKIELIGSSKCDVLNFTSGLDNLKTARPHDLDGYIYAGGSLCPDIPGPDGDVLNGSNNSGNDFYEHLYGEGDTDFIYGNDDADEILAGPGDDEVYAGAGNDKVDGEEGNDIVNGEDGHDTLCERNRTSTGACKDGGTGNVYMGGAGTDRIWLNEDPACPALDLTGLSTPGAEPNEECGDAAVYGVPSFLGCETAIYLPNPPQCPW